MALAGSGLSGWGASLLVSGSSVGTGGAICRTAVIATLFHALVTPIATKP